MRVIRIYNFDMNTKISPAAIHGNAEPRQGGASGTPMPSPGRRVSSDEIFGKQQEIEIEHNGALYRLRKTSLGKLILTK